MHTAHADGILPGILDRISDARLCGRLPIVVFDLDDTVFSRINRHLGLLRDFVEHSQAAAPLKQAARMLLEDGEAGGHWSVAEAATLSGVDVHELKKAMHDFWIERVHRHERAPEDGQVAGAPEFIRALLCLRGEVVFLTRRDESQRAATVATLVRNGFPAPGEMPWKDRVQLKMKPADGRSELEFKLAAVDALGKQGEVIACFEHNPAVLEKFLQHFPGTSAVLVNMHHASKHPIRDPRIVAVEDLTAKQ